MTLSAALPPLLQTGGLVLAPETLEKLEAYHAFLMEKNAVMDLTNVLEEEMAVRHYADSLLPLAQADWFPTGGRCVDVGSGAGFPGLMLALARPDMRFTLLDAQRKRCDFLAEAAQVAGAANVQVVHARAEDAARGPLRGSADAALARAVSPLNTLLEYLLPFVKPGGLALCWKGPALDTEAKAARHACAVLGGSMESAFRLPLAERTHWVQPVRKTGTTPARYPRRAGTPAKEPL